MLIQFSIKNYKSFKELTTLTMDASSIKELSEDNVFTIQQRGKDVNLLKSAVIYGANASGKSNLIDALSFMKEFVKNSSKDTQSNEKIPIQKFLLDKNSEKHPSFFEIVFLRNNVRFRYGFEVDNEKIHSEWLFHAPKGKEAKLFLREKTDIFDIGPSFKGGKKLENITRNNALFLSVSAQFKGEISNLVLSWFDSLKIITQFDANDLRTVNFTSKKLSNPEFRKKVIEFIKKADLGISDLKILKRKIPSEITKELEKLFTAMVLDKGKKEQALASAKDAIESEILFTHKKYIKKNQIESIDFSIFNESLGTRKIYALAGQIIDSLENGSTLVIDEFEARLHPIISRFIVKQFNSKKNNPSNSQLVLTSHDTNLLRKQLFRRDQIWFLEKSEYGHSELFSLNDFNVRSESIYSKDYLQGKFGAIPVIDDFSSIFEVFNE